MADKSFFVDTTKCTACRGCQIACKQWNKNPGTKTIQRGTHQNPEDLSVSTFKLVRFSEFEVNGQQRWYFFADQCRHCIEPPCMYTAQSFGYKSIIRDEKTGGMAKCTMCIDRIKEGLLPACVKTCPTGAMNFGDRAKILDMAKNRLKEVKATSPKAQLLNAEVHRTIFLVVDDPKRYHKFAAENDVGITRIAALKKLIQPFVNLSRITG